MQRSKMLSVSIISLLTMLLLLNRTASFPTVRAQPPTPTNLAPRYAEITANNAQYLKQQLEIGNGTGYMPRWSPDGKYLAVGGSKGIWLLDAEALDQPPHLAIDDSNIIDFAFSPDSTLIASIGTANMRGDDRLGPAYLRIGDLVRGWATAPLLIYAGVPMKLTFSPDGKFLAYAAAWSPVAGAGVVNDCIHLFGLNQGALREISTFPCQAQSDFYAESHLTFSPDGNWLTFGTNLSDIQIINLRTSKVTSTSLLSTYLHQSSRITVSFTPDSSNLIINSGTHAYVIILALGVQMNVWRDKQTGKDHPIKGSLTYSDDGQKLYEIVGGQDYTSTLNIWDANEGQLLATTKLPEIYQMGFQNPQNRTIILKRTNVVGEGRLPERPAFLVVDDQTGQTQFGFDGFGKNTYSDLSPDGKRLAILRALYTSNIGALAIVDLATGKQQPLPAFWTDDIGVYQFHPNGNILAVSSSTGVHFWNLHKKTELYASPSLLKFALSPDAQWLAEQPFPTNAINLYEFQSHLLMHTVELPDNIKQVAFTSDSRAALVVVSHFDGTGKLSVVRIDVASGATTNATPIHIFDTRWYFPAPSDDGRLLVIAMEDGMVIWNIETDSIIPLEVTKNRKFVRWTFNQTQTLLAGIEVEPSAETSQDKPVRVVVWDVISGKLLQTFVTRATLNNYKGYAWPPIFSFSPNGARIYFNIEPSLQRDPWDLNLDRLGQPTGWDIATGKQIAAYPLDARAFVSSPTQDILAIAASNNIYVFSPDLANLHWKLAIPVQNLNFSPDGKWLVRRGYDNQTLTLFAIDENQLPTPQPQKLTPVASR